VKGQLTFHQVEVISRDAQEWVPSADVLHHSCLVVYKVVTTQELESLTALLAPCHVSSTPIDLPNKVLEAQSGKMLEYIVHQLRDLAFILLDLEKLFKAHLPAGLFSHDVLYLLAVDLLLLDHLQDWIIVAKGIRRANVLCRELVCHMMPSCLFLLFLILENFCLLSMQIDNGYNPLYESLRFDFFIFGILLGVTLSFGFTLASLKYFNLLWLPATLLHGICKQAHDCIS
jgi:hypothetical protein